MTYQDLRQKYPKFIYKSFSKEVAGNDLVLKFAYQTPPDHTFVHTLTLTNLKDSNDTDTLIFNIGLSEMLSYWKATCSPIVEIQAGLLTTDQIVFWHKLFINGMGEYFYKNNIDFTPIDFIEIVSKNDNHMTMNDNRMTMNDKILVPIGGGKDSIVTLEILKKHFDVLPLIINPTLSMTSIAPEAIIVKRVIDPYLLKLNSEGYLNGHVPLSSSIAFISILVAKILDCPYVTLSNERSSNEGNVSYLGHEVNHQYSKSLEFETDLNGYLTDITNVKYFSFLRPMYEIQIAKLFSKYPQYFNIFTSCNKTLKTGKSWCKNCPKCVSTALLLSPWIGKDGVTKIMGAYPPDLPENKIIMEELTGIRPVKPFECVLTRDEALGKIDMNSWLPNPNMPIEFENILKSEI